MGGEKGVLEQVVFTDDLEPVAHPGVQLKEAEVLKLFT